MTTNQQAMFGMNRDDMKALGNDQQVDNAGFARDRLEGIMAGKYTSSKAEMNQLANQYENFMHDPKQMDKSVDSFMKVSLAGLSAPVDEGRSLPQAITAQKQSAAAVAEAAEHSLGSIVARVADKLDTMWAGMASFFGSKSGTTGGSGGTPTPDQRKTAAAITGARNMFYAPDHPAVAASTSANALADASLAQARSAVAHGVKEQCAKYVEKAFDQVGLTGLTTPGAKDLVPLLSHDKRFRELDPQEISQRGDIDVYTPGTGKSAGQRI
jgi:hypothetical protein